MSLLVDPPQRDGADDRPPGEVSAAAPGDTATVPRLPSPSQLRRVGARSSRRRQSPRRPSRPRPTTQPRLAEPPLTGGRVEALMGSLIRVLSHSPLARPLPAVSC